MDYEALEKQVYGLITSKQLAQAEELILREQPSFTGRSLGRVHWLHAALVRRIHPDDREGFHALCKEAANLVQGDQATLCQVYLTQSAAAMAWGEFRTALSLIRRIRALAKRHPDVYAIQRTLGAVLGNEGLIAYIQGNFAQAAECLVQGTNLMERYFYPPHEPSRRTIIASVLVDAASSYLALGDRTRAMETLARIDPALLRPEDTPRYCAAQSRYWLALGTTARAREWFNKIEGRAEEWRPEWPVLLLELEADLAMAEGNPTKAVELITSAAAQPYCMENQILKTRLQSKRLELERMLSQ